MDGPPTAHAPHLLLSSCPPAHSVGLPPRPPLLSLWAITLWFFLEPTWLAATYYSRFQSTVTTLWYHILSLCLYRVSLHLGTYELPCDDLFTRLCPRIRDSQDGDQSLMCVSPGPGTVSTWLKAFPFLLEGKEKGYHPSTLLKLSSMSPLRAERGLQTGAVTVRLHRARSLCWRGSRQGIQGSWHDGTQELALYMTRTDCPGDAHSIHCTPSMQRGGGVTDGWLGGLQSSWKRGLGGGCSLAGPCWGGAGGTQESPRLLLTLNGQPSPAVCEGSLQHIQFDGELKFIAGISFFFNHVSPLGKRCRVFVDRKNRKSHIHKGDQI